MNDLEICKRIAEIEGAKETLYSRIKPKELTAVFDNSTHFNYNPLTDDALCFQLMVKYKVRMHWLWEENDGTPHYEAYINEDGSDIKYGKSPNEIILLCIIEAQNER